MDEGLARERAFSIELENSDQARALRYAFFAEREVAKLPDIPAAVAPKDFQTVALVGAGTMGGGIAMSFADFGYPVKIMDATTEALDRGLQKIRDNYATSVRRGSVTEDEMRRRLARIEPVASYDDIGQCDIVIEAAMPVRRRRIGEIPTLLVPDGVVLGCQMKEEAIHFSYVFFDKEYHVEGSQLQRFAWFRRKRERR